MDDPILFDQVFKPKSSRFQQTITSLPNLVAYYPLNEASGNAINRAPATVGSLNGTVTGATQNQQGLLGRAYSFNGSDNFVTVADNTVLDGYPAMSWGIFIKLRSVATQPDMLFSKDGSYRFFVDANSFVFQFGTTDQAYATSFDSNVLYATYLNQWVFLAVTYDKDGGSNNMKWYINGVQATLRSSTGNMLSSSPDLIIGADTAVQRYIDALEQHLFITSNQIPATKLLQIAQLAGLA